jgi:hypothetical protein
MMSGASRTGSEFLIISSFPARARGHGANAREVRCRTVSKIAGVLRSVETTGCIALPMTVSIASESRVVRVRSVLSRLKRDAPRTARVWRNGVPRRCRVDRQPSGHWPAKASCSRLPCTPRFPPPQPSSPVRSIADRPPVASELLFLVTRDSARPLPGPASLGRVTRSDELAGTLTSRGWGYLLAWTQPKGGGRF